MKERTPALLLVSGLLLLSACSGTDQPAIETTAIIPTTSTTVAGSRLSAEPIPPPKFDSGLTGDDLLVAIEARWMCDVQRFAFSDLGAMSEALEERLASHGLKRTDYDAFKVDMEGRIDLREQVLAEYESYCGED
jgi:hypothetical protein